MSKIKFVAYILLIILIVSTVGCSKTDTTPPDSNETIVETTEPESTHESFVSEEVIVSDFDDIPEDIKGTIIPIDSLLLYHTETGNTYDTNDSYMLWRTLQYAFGNFGLNYNRVELKDYAFSAEPMTVGEFTTAILDDDYENYPIPEKLSEDVWYDSENDIYCFSIGDRGLSQTEILTYQYLEDHNLKITARLYALDDNSTICEGIFYFKRNKYASGVVEPLFYYTVTNVEFTNSSNI